MMPDSRRNKSRRGRTIRGAQRGGHRFELRIIAGKWRGRRIGFAQSPEIRPTPDRVRETLFNWLQPQISGSRCLDLYAGSGALGLEALSRGAESAVFVEAEVKAVRQIEATLASLDAQTGRVEHIDATRFLGASHGSFDIIFLDPPYSMDRLARDCRLIEERQLLQPGGLIYLEGPAGFVPQELPKGWTVLRSKKAGAVGYHLARRSVEVAGSATGADEMN